MLPVYMYGVEETLREQFLDAMERDMSRRESKAAAMRLEYATSDLKRMMRLIDKLETISCVVIQLRGRTAQDVGEAAQRECVGAVGADMSEADDGDLSFLQHICISLLNIWFGNVGC